MNFHSPAALILAAGTSTRMGQPKPLLDWGGKPLIQVVVEAALTARLHPLVIVTGAARQRITAALSQSQLQFVHNPAYASGQSSSLRVGIAALPESVSAVLVLLADQPFVTPALLEQLVATWQTTAAAIVAPRYRGVRGNPVLFSRACFADLMAITGDQGARALLQSRASEITFVDFDDDRPMIDIDTPELYAQYAPGSMQ